MTFYFVTSVDLKKKFFIKVEEFRKRSITDAMFFGGRSPFF